MNTNTGVGGMGNMAGKDNMGGMNHMGGMDHMGGMNNMGGMNDCGGMGNMGMTSKTKPMNEREALLWKVQAYEFACVEVGLFLNTHPTDKTALAYFKQYREMKNKLESEFTKRFGPLTATHMDNDLSTWRWIENPWPWEIGREV